MGEKVPAIPMLKPFEPRPLLSDAEIRLRLVELVAQRGLPAVRFRAEVDYLFHYVQTGSWHNAADVRVASEAD
jgi:hypothetical protein